MRRKKTMVNIQNGIITMNRGDTFYMPLHINYGDKLVPKQYTLTSKDTIYFALEEYNQPFEVALIRKVFTMEDLDADNNVVIQFPSEDTQYILPGEYYYEIKLRHIENEGQENEQEFIDTIVPRRKFIILE